MPPLAIVNSSGRPIALEPQLSQAADNGTELGDAGRAQLAHGIVQQL
jgi:hypothetical protein